MYCRSSFFGHISWFTNFTWQEVVKKLLIFISKLKVSIFKIRINHSYKYNFNLETFFYQSAYHVMYSICANKRMFCKVCVFVSVRWIVKSRAARSRKISLKTLQGGLEMRRSGSIFWYLAELIVKNVSITAVKKHNPRIIKKEKKRCASDFDNWLSGKFSLFVFMAANYVQLGYRT